MVHGAGILAASNHGTIANVFTSGSITSATSDAGDAFAGLVVQNLGTITESYATGPVSSLSTHGGAGGLVAYGNGTITQSFASGRVGAVAPRIGGICEGCAGLGNDVYWNVQTTGQASSGGNLTAANGLASAQMSNPASFVGWDFSSNGAWAMPSGATQPVLRWQITAH